LYVWDFVLLSVFLQDKFWGFSLGSVYFAAMIEDGSSKRLGKKEVNLCKR